MKLARASALGGLVIVALAICLVLLHHPGVVAGTSRGTPAQADIGRITGSARLCQTDEVIPRGTTQVVVWIGTGAGPNVSLEISEGGRVVSRGSRPGGWTSFSTIVPVDRLTRKLPDARICLTLAPRYENVAIGGQRASSSDTATLNGRPLMGFVAIEYLRPSSQSWVASFGGIIERMGLGRQPSGTWISILAIVLAAAFISIAVWLLVAGPDGQTSRAQRDSRGGERLRAGARWLRQFAHRRRLPHSFGMRERLRWISKAGLLCAVVGFASAACWSLITPPFQATDEPDHFAYVKQLAETASLPSSRIEPIEAGGELGTTLEALKFEQVRERPRDRTIASRAEQEELSNSLSSLGDEPESEGSPAAGVATSQPPLYYAVASVPYLVGGSILVRLQLIRLLGALLAGVTVLFIYLFVREALPALPWAWSIAGLSAALSPLLGANSGVVNPDTLLFAIAAASFFSVARGFRRGLTLKRALAIGTLVALGSLTKANFVGLVPGLMLGLLVLAWRARSVEGRRAYRWLAGGFAIAVAPISAYAVVNALSNHSLLGVVSGVINSGHPLLHEASYVWQLFLPRIPGMHNDFPNFLTTQSLWFDGLVGRYGWLDATFPPWVYNAALVPAGAVAVLAVSGVVSVRRTIWSRWSELGIYSLLALGVLAMIGIASFTAFPLSEAYFAEPRYLLPLLPLFAAGIALAVRGAGRRWAPAIGALIVTLTLAHDLLSQVLTISRYYS